MGLRARWVPWAIVAGLGLAMAAGLFLAAGWLRSSGALAAGGFTCNMGGPGASVCSMPPGQCLRGSGGVPPALGRLVDGDAGGGTIPGRLFSCH